MVLLFTHFKYKRTNPCAKLSLGPFNYYVFAVRGRGKVGHSIITSALRGEEEGGGGSSIKMRTYLTRGRECHINANVRILFFLIEHLIHKLFTIVIGFPVLLKISVLKKLYLVRVKDHKSITFNYVCFEQLI